MSYMINGQPANITEEPFEQNGKNYVPLDEVVRALGGNVNWDNGNKTAHATIGQWTANVQMDNVPVHNDYRDVDEYVSRSNEMGGMFSRAWRAAPENEREAMTQELRDAFEPFAVDGGYELPGHALCVLAS